MADLPPMTIEEAVSTIKLAVIPTSSSMTPAEILRRNWIEEAIAAIEKRLEITALAVKCVDEMEMILSRDMDHLHPHPTVRIAIDRAKVLLKKANG